MPAQLTVMLGGRLYLLIASSITFLMLSGFVTSNSNGKCVPTK